MRSEQVQFSNCSFFILKCSQVTEKTAEPSERNTTLPTRANGSEKGLRFETGPHASHGGSCKVARRSPHFNRLHSTPCVNSGDGRADNWRAECRRATLPPSRSERIARQVSLSTKPQSPVRPANHALLLRHQQQRPEA